MKNSRFLLEEAVSKKQLAVEAIFERWMNLLENILDKKVATADLMNHGYVKILEGDKDVVFDLMSEIKERNLLTDATLDELSEEAFQKVRDALEKDGWKIDDKATRLDPCID